MRHNRIVYGLACGVVIAVAQGAMADLVEFTFSGIVTSSEPTGNPPGPSSGVNVGDTFSGHFRFDTNALLTEISDFFATSGTVVVDFEVRFFSAGTGSLISSWDFSNDGDPIGTPGSDFFSIRNDHPAAEFPDGIELEDREVLNGQDVIYQTRFDDTTGSVFESLEIPETLDLDDFDFNHFQIQSLTDSWIVRGEITELVLVPPDSDGDGVPDDADCQPDSDLSETVVIDGCDSDVENVLFGDGCTIRDLITECVDGANTHGQFMSCVAQVTKDLKQQGIISGQEKGAIQSCAAQAFFCPSP